MNIVSRESAMSKKKRKHKKKSPTLNELKKKLSDFVSNVANGKRIGFEMLKNFKPQTINLIEKERKKDKKHKKDYKHESH